MPVRPPQRRDVSDRKRRPLRRVDVRRRAMHLRRTHRSDPEDAPELQRPDFEGQEEREIPGIFEKVRKQPEEQQVLRPHHCVLILNHARGNHNKVVVLNKLSYNE